LAVNEIPQVIYAPQKILKRVIENPKYLAAIIIFILFIGVMIGYEYVQFSKTDVEITSPTVGNLPTFLNETLWTAPSYTSLSNNGADFFNYSVYAPNGTSSSVLSGYYSLFGNTSLEMDASNANNIMANLTNVFNVDCGAPSGFQNLSMTIKQVEPAGVPQSATLTLYSVNASNFYTYDLTSDLSNASAIGLWNNLTIPVGPNAQGWAIGGGSPSWGKVTALQLAINYPSGSNITVRIGALFFRGQYESALALDGTEFALGFLEAFSLQFLFTWLVLTGIIYLFFKLLKATVTWKPLFVAVAFALLVMVIRGVVNIAAAATLPTVYYPFEATIATGPNLLGALTYPSAALGALSTQSQVAVNAIYSATAGFGDVILVMFAVSYVWLGALCTIIVGTLKQDYSMTKRIVISAASIGVTILLLLLLIGVV